MKSFYTFPPSAYLGMPLKKEKHVIYGAGIAGLLTGFWLKKKGVDFKIYEKTGRAGGLIGTDDHELGQTEYAANGFIYDEVMKEMLETLDLERLPSSKVSNAKYFIRNDELKKFPLSASETVNALFRFLFRFSKPVNTVEDFGDSYFNKKFTRYILSPAMKGIYAAPAGHLSFPAALPTIATMQQKRSLLWLSFLSGGKKNKSDKSTSSFSSGMGVLIKALEDYLASDIEYNTDVTSLVLENKPLISCLPAYTAAELFKGHPLSDLLKRVEYSPVTSTTVFVKKEDVKNFKPGFGCLFPEDEGWNMMGILFNNMIFPERVKKEGVLSMTCISRGNIEKDKILEDLDRLFTLKGDPLKVDHYHYKKGIPLYSPELFKLWKEADNMLRSDFPEVRLFGNYTGKISIRGMCVEANKAVESMS